MRITDNGLVLRRVPWRDNSWITTLLTPHQGMITAMARAARRGDRDGTRGALSGFHRLDLEIRTRSLEVMGTLTRVEIVEARNRLPSMATAMAAAQLLMEAVLRGLLPGDPGDGEVFVVLDGALGALEAGIDPLTVAAGTIHRLLGQFGHGWRLHDCVGCGSCAELLFFSVRRGGVVCSLCGTPYARRLPTIAPRVRQALADRSWPPALAGLTRDDLQFCYLLGMAGITRILHRSLDADPWFRQLTGLTPTRSLHHDRQSTAGNPGLSPMQRDIGV
ncbi:MAG: DNA repair protein RecO [Magnetococcales bacterium]|nr:DNA repair protein RecO [Magnetococcales bacterium]